MNPVLQGKQFPLQPPWNAFTQGLYLRVHQQNKIVDYTSTELYPLSEATPSSSLQDLHPPALSFTNWFIRDWDWSRRKMFSSQTFNYLGNMSWFLHLSIHSWHKSPIKLLSSLRSCSGCRLILLQVQRCLTGGPARCLEAPRMISRTCQDIIKLKLSSSNDQVQHHWILILI